MRGRWAPRRSTGGQRGIGEVRWKGEANRRLPSICFRNIRKYPRTSVSLQGQLPPIATEKCCLRWSVAAGRRLVVFQPGYWPTVSSFHPGRSNVYITVTSFMITNPDPDDFVHF